MVRFRFLLSLLIFIALFTSCKTNQSLTTGARYEDDEVYYKPGESFYTDVISSSSSADTQSSENNASNSSEEDYYSGQPADGGIVNNYYGDVYQGGWGGNGFARPGGRLMWDPIWGWRMSYGFGGGFNSGWGMSYGMGWGGYNGWYDPFYDPFYNSWNNPWAWGYNPYYNNFYGYNGWGSPYYNPWGWNNVGNPWAWNESGGGIVFGHRPSLSSNSSYNSGISSQPRRTRSSFLTSPNGSTGTYSNPNNGRNPGTKTDFTRPAINRGGQDEEYNPTRPSRPSQGEIIPDNRPTERPRQEPSRVEPSRPSREPSRVEPTPSRGRDNSPPSRPSIERNSPPPSRPSQGGGGGTRGGGNNSGGSPRRR